jgi:branched-chain amino acid transport system permease protein
LDYLTRAPWGRDLHAVREDEDAAMALGRDAYVLKLSSFGIGCAIMGLAGVLSASFLQVINPDQFVPAATFGAYVVMILGGSGNNRGVVLGGYLFFLFTWMTQQVKGYLPSDVNFRLDYLLQIAIGALLILFMLFRPEGVMPEKKYVPRAKG